MLEQNRRIDRLETYITVFNIAAVPLLVVIFGVVLAVRRRSLQATR